MSAPVSSDNDASKESDDGDEQAMMMDDTPLTPTNDSEVIRWVVDSGCPEHMSNDIRLFTSLDVVDSITIRTAGKETIEVNRKKSEGRNSPAPRRQKRRKTSRSPPAKAKTTDDAPSVVKIVVTMPDTAKRASGLL
jgi:hypothetical protein